MKPPWRSDSLAETGFTGGHDGLRGLAGTSARPRGHPVPALSLVSCRRSASDRAGVQPPLTCGIEEIVDCAWVSAELTDDVPVIAAWIAVHSACDTFG